MSQGDFSGIADMLDSLLSGGNNRGVQGMTLFFVAHAAAGARRTIDRHRDRARTFDWNGVCG